MADVFYQEKRSEVRSRIHSNNTLIERDVFRFLRRNKVYYVRHYIKTPGVPDIARPMEKSCFSGW